jgi:acyl dehydratase
MALDVPALEAVGAGRYRERWGFYLEDFEVGAVIEHRPGRTITETDNVWQSLIVTNDHPIHIDRRFAERSEFGRLLVSSLVTFAVVNAMTVSTVSARAIANLGWDRVRLPNPVFVGDTLYAESEILTVRESRSRPTQGIVTIATTGRKHDGTVVLTCERTILVPKHGYGVSDDAG